MLYTCDDPYTDGDDGDDDDDDDDEEDDPAAYGDDVCDDNDHGHGYTDGPHTVHYSIKILRDLSSKT